MKQIQTHIEIKANVSTVWDVLMDFENHTKWNPFIKSITGRKNVGEKITVSIKPKDGNGMTFKPKILVLNNNQEFRWKGKFLITGIFDGEHYFILEYIDDNTTNFIHGENFSGLLVSLSSKMLEKTREGFELMNKALKIKCESI